jgi:hypothetical protein
MPARSDSPLSLSEFVVSFVTIRVRLKIQTEDIASQNQDYAVASLPLPQGVSLPGLTRVVFVVTLSLALWSLRESGRVGG